MEQEEAKKVLKIMTEADGCCPHCASDLFIEFVKEFGHKELTIEIFSKEFKLTKEKTEEYLDLK